MHTDSSGTIIYQAVGNHCAVDLTALVQELADKHNHKISKADALAILEVKGLRSVMVDFISIGRSLIGKAQHHRPARMAQAPDVVSCSSLTKYLYGLLGIWLPRRAIQQKTFGSPVAITELQAGDLVFRRGLLRRTSFYDDPNHGIGHVGLSTGDKTIIHATNHKRGVVEDPVDQFTADKRYPRGACRIIPADSQIVTLKTLDYWEVETSDDIKWIILQSL
ncbi:MAG TPA: NlpC/P60 family protein [Patescibacteria group bacterium]